MPPLVIACGDPTGIGPEVSVRAVSQVVAAEPAESAGRFVLVGDRNQLQAWQRRLGCEFLTAPGGAVSLLDPRPEPVDPAAPPGGPSTARAALDYLARAAAGCETGEFSALVTAPVSKQAILRAGVPFTGQTEFLADRCGGLEVTMMLLGDDDRGRWLRVALATTHLPLRAVADALTTADVMRALRHSHNACRALGLPRARIAVCGLNPHAGEGGMMGDEEGRVIAPAVAEARAGGLDAHGPVPADTLFHQAFRGDYDVVVAMYHDQGLGPLKLVAFERGVNWTLGLPYPRTSPDHGTAFDIAGHGLADPTSMGAAIRLALRLTWSEP